MHKKKGKTAISPLLTFNLKVGFTFSVLSPKACPYVMMQFALSDKLISEDWFFVEGEWFFMFLFWK